MDFTVSNSLSDSLGALRRAQNARAYALPVAKEKEDVALPVATKTPANVNAPQGTQLVGESQDDLDGGGYRRTRVYAREDGRTFTKIEEFALTDRGARKTVIQQNPSGSITRYEEILDRESTGSFRRTQRFQDETGEIATQITPGYQVRDLFILTGGNAAPAFTPTFFEPSRGTQLDLRA